MNKNLKTLSNTQKLELLKFNNYTSNSKVLKLRMIKNFYQKKKKKLVRTSKIGIYSKTQKLKPFKIIFLKKTKRCFECVGTTIDRKVSSVFQETKKKKKKKKRRRRKRKSRVKTRGKWSVLYIAYWGNQQSKNTHRKF